MNNDLISREALKKALSDKDLITWTHEYGDAIPLEWIMSTIDNAPTVDNTCPHCDSGYAQGYSDGYLKGKEDRPQGEWIEQTEYNGDTYYDCSVCGNSWTTIEGTPWDNGMNFCPNCGAQMKGGAE